MNKIKDVFQDDKIMGFLLSVLIALLGGLIWQQLGIEILFSIAAIFGMAGIIFSLLLEKEKDLSGSRI